MEKQKDTIENVITGLAEKLGLLHSSIETLAGKLAPIMRPANENDVEAIASPVVGSCTGPPVEASALFAELERMSHETDAAIGKVQRLEAFSQL